MIPARFPRPMSRESIAEQPANENMDLATQLRRSVELLEAAEQAVDREIIAAFDGDWFVGMNRSGRYELV